MNFNPNNLAAGTAIGLFLSRCFRFRTYAPTRRTVLNSGKLGTHFSAIAVIIWFQKWLKNVRRFLIPWFIFPAKKARFIWNNWNQVIKGTKVINWTSVRRCIGPRDDLFSYRNSTKEVGVTEYVVFTRLVACSLSLILSLVEIGVSLIHFSSCFYIHLKSRLFPNVPMFLVTFKTFDGCGLA